MREMPAAFELRPRASASTPRRKAQDPRRTARPARRRYRSHWRTYQIWDHLPIWAELQIGFSDEYLTEIAAPRAVISGRPRQPVRMSFLFTNSSAP